MKIVEILPELEIGGVEEHVISLSNELSRRGHEVTVISAGGPLSAKFVLAVRQWMLPVHKKNLFTILNCGKQIGIMAKKEKWQLIHAHSRVPAWIAWRSTAIASLPFIVTAHSNFSTKTKWIYYPYRKAAKTVCVSKAVQNGMKDCFYDNTVVIQNGLDEPKIRWRPTSGPVKFLFVGRLTELKGVQDVLRALPEEYSGWRFDVVGDGPYREKLELIAVDRGIKDRVIFHGYSDHIDEFMRNSSCLLFPSHMEGMPLTLARAVQMGVPIIASNIGPVVEMAGSADGLLEPANIEVWNTAIKDFIDTRKTSLHISAKRIPTTEKMVGAYESLYDELIYRYK